jgi:hypothetical protein
MDVDVLDAAGRLTRQARREEVVDVADLRVKCVEHLGSHAKLLRQLIPGSEVDEARRLRADRIVVDKRPSRRCATLNPDTNR